MKKRINFNYYHIGRQKIVDILLSKKYSDNNIYYLLKAHHVIVNHKYVEDKNYHVPFFSKIEVTLNREDNELPVIQHSIDIVYEDEYLMIVSKPSGLDIEPTKQNYEETLASYIGYYYQQNEIPSKIHFVNRLDKLTSGLIIVAKNQYIHHLFENVRIKKKYICLAEGKTDKKGIIKIRISKEENSIKRIVTSDGKECITKYQLIRYEGNNSLLDISLLTGRTHQIRVSLQSIGHPIVNDPLYGHQINQDNMYLKAYHLQFIHPVTHHKIKVSI